MNFDEIKASVYNEIEVEEDSSILEFKKQTHPDNPE